MIRPWFYRTQTVLQESGIFRFGRSLSDFLWDGWGATYGAYGSQIPSILVSFVAGLNSVICLFEVLFFLLGSFSSMVHALVVWFEARTFKLPLIHDMICGGLYAFTVCSLQIEWGTTHLCSRRVSYKIQQLKEFGVEWDPSIQYLWQARLEVRETPIQTGLILQM